MKSKEALQDLRFYTSLSQGACPYSECNELCDLIENDLKVLECFKEYFDFELVFENNQTFLVFKSKERYLAVEEKIPIANKYYEPLKRWLEK